MHKYREELLKEIMEKIGYKFKDKEILNRALTHSSYANEHRKKKIQNNERLEFLGDSVLGLCVSDYIFMKYPNYPEGELTKLRATVVCEPSLAYIARKMCLGKYLLLGNGEEATGGRSRDSILADAFESLIGAIYVDGGMVPAKKFVLINLKDIIHNAVNGFEIFIDYKTQLQEVLQKQTKSKIDYRILKEEGPDHNKIFYMEVRVGNKVIGSGYGRSKKEAEQSSARRALYEMGLINE